MNGTGKHAKQDALNALASARVIAESPDGFVHEIQLEQMRLLLRLAEKYVGEIHELQRVRAPKPAPGRAVTGEEAFERFALAAEAGR